MFPTSTVPAAARLDLTPTEAAAALGVSERSVLRYIADGRLVARRVDRKRIVISRDALAAFLARGVPISPTPSLTSPMA